MMHGEKGGEMIRLKTGADEQVFACLRKKDTSKVLFIVNLSGKKSKVKIENEDLTGEWIDIFDAKGTPVPSKSTYSTTLEPWSYQALRYKKQ
jgi:hypothetical protein